MVYLQFRASCEEGPSDRSRHREVHQYRTHTAYFNLWLRLDQVVYMPSYNLNHVRSVRSVVERPGIVSSHFFPSNNHRKRYNHKNKLQIQFRLIETCGNIVK